MGISNVKEHSACNQKEYEDFMLESYNLKVNASKLSKYNNADNMAYRFAFASLKSLNNSASFKPLPGLDYSIDQLFWIIAAQQYCVVNRNEDVQRSAMQNDFPIEIFRVNGPLRNNYEFIETFNCKAGTNMNPDDDKCILN